MTYCRIIIIRPIVVCEVHLVEHGFGVGSLTDPPSEDNKLMDRPSPGLELGDRLKLLGRLSHIGLKAALDVGHRGGT